MLAVTKGKHQKHDKFIVESLKIEITLLFLLWGARLNETSYVQCRESRAVVLVCRTYLRMYIDVVIPQKRKTFLSY
jgi:hypothetical protein